MFSPVKHKLFFRIFASCLLVEMLFASGLPVAARVRVPSASESSAEMEQRYHIDPDAAQSLGENLNVADQKKTVPEASISFSPSDPKEGEKLTAKAFPMYFTNDKSKLYYTWYLQQEACRPGKPVTPDCDLDDDGRHDVNDWKIKAHQILASNEFQTDFETYATDTDDDGYRAIMGGDNKSGVNNHCFFYDKESGTNYEIVEDAKNTDWNCPNAQPYPVCMVESQSVNPGTIAVDATASGSSGASTASGEIFSTTAGNYYVSGTPYCGAMNAGVGTPSCMTGTPCCVANPTLATSCEFSLTLATLACTVPAIGDIDPWCKHIFPEPPARINGVPIGAGTVGDGGFSALEEKFWRTDPHDPDTADNGNKDEANVAGLGQENFTWNYQKGDKIGVVIEGTSMLGTKYKDSSNAIMWAFSKNETHKTDRQSGKTLFCGKERDKGTITKTIEGYQVVMPTMAIDPNDCLEANLIDPTEGGQATNLELSVMALPEDVTNDISLRGDGDVLEAIATVTNGAKGIEGIYYAWKVEISADGTANPPVGGWQDITTALNNFDDGKGGKRKLLSQVKGNGVNKVQLNMNIRATDVLSNGAFSRYLKNGVGYLKFKVDVAENLNAEANRRGRSSVIVKFTASEDKMLAYPIDVAGIPAHVSLNKTNGEICSGVVNPGDTVEQQALSRLDAKLCRVIRNEIIGVEIPNDSGTLSNFNWTINGQPLICNSRVSTVSCFDNRQGNVNFFPVVGAVGDTFNISVTANKVSEIDVKTGAGQNQVVNSSEKSISISRTFKIVQPTLNIGSTDTTAVWAKTLGQYVDTKGVAFTEYSKDTLETYRGNTVPLRAIFTPDFLGRRAPPAVERSWSVDGVAVGDGAANTISFPANKEGKAVYNVSLSAVYRPSTDVRKAMEDIWGLSALDTTEIYFSNNTQVEQKDVAGIGATGVKKYYALLANYLPSSVLFSLKVLFSVFLILATSGVVFALIPNVPETAVNRPRPFRK